MGIPLTDTTIYTPCFVDDQIPVANVYHNIEYMTHKIIKEYRKWGLEVNTQKQNLREFREYSKTLSWKMGLAFNVVKSVNILT